MQTICKKRLSLATPLQNCKKAKHIIMYLIKLHLFNKIVKLDFFLFFWHLSAQREQKENYFL